MQPSREFFTPPERTLDPGQIGRLTVVSVPRTAWASIVPGGLAWSLGVFATLLAPAQAEESVKPATPRVDHSQPMFYQTAIGQILPVTTVDDWQYRRLAILGALHEVMGPLPGKEKRGPLQIEVQEEVDCGLYFRRLLTFSPEPKGRIPVYLLIPKEALRAGQTAPAILCLHQTHALGQKVVAGLGNSPNDEYAVELAKQGFVCLAPAYPLLANYQPDLKALGYQSGTMKAIWDNIRCLDLLESLSFVRPAKFGAIGHSLGGHNAIFTAVFDERIKVIVSSCGFDSFKDYMGGDIKGWTSDRYMPKLAKYPLAEIPFDFHELISALAPRVCFASAPFYDTNFSWRSVFQIEEAAAKVYALHGVTDRLRIEHPKVGHEFPKEMRDIAYQLFKEQLR